LCGHDPAYNFHHFIPRTLHSNKWFKRRYRREQMQHGLNVCRGCHHAIHDLIPSEKDLGRHYSTRELLLAHPELAKYVRWKSRKSKAQP